MQSYALRSTVDISSRVSADHQYSKSAGLWEKTGYSSSAIREVNAAFSEYDTLVRYGKQSVQKKATNQEKKQEKCTVSAVIRRAKLSRGQQLLPFLQKTNLSEVTGETILRKHTPS